MPEETYDLKSIQFTRLAGTPLQGIVELVESPLGGLLIPNLLQSAGVSWLRKQTIDDPPTWQPLHFPAPSPTAGPADPASRPSEGVLAEPVSPGPGFHFFTIRDYAVAYREGKLTPEDVAEKVLAAIENSNAATPSLRAVIATNRDEVLRQAQESTRRIKAGQARSLFEGVPVAIKDEIDLQPYPTTVGTAFLGQAPCGEDAAVSARMRAAGALLIGKTNMHEIGIGVTGLNPIHGTPRNPYDPQHYTGGSSSGSAAAVAAGLCPVAIGADGGGSIRIPASFCGVVGLKPTYGRVSEYGAAPLCWSVAHIGPLAATAADAALAYALIAGPDPRDPNSRHQPDPALQGFPGWNDPDLHGLKLGVYWPWFRHASAEVVAACEALLQRFEQQGAQIQAVSIPDLEAGRIAHTVTIAGEMAQALSHHYAKNHRQHGLDVRLNLALAHALTTCDYVRAQRVRTRLMAHFNRALAAVDLLITPATGLTAPRIPPDALIHGESDIATLVEIMRFATPGNLTGLPAISFPAGYNAAGLPVGMQAIGRPWQEPQLLRLARIAETLVERRPPQIHYRLLPE